MSSGGGIAWGTSTFVSGCTVLAGSSTAGAVSAEGSGAASGSTSTAGVDSASSVAGDVRELLSLAENEPSA